MWVVFACAVIAVLVSLVASIGLARANPRQSIPQAGNRRIGVFVGAWVVVVAAVIVAVVEGPHPAGGLATLVTVVALAPLTVVMLRHNGEVRRRDAASGNGAERRGR